ncbi:hypothetical protein O9993_03560 [Vibrio lentus]|nr:hypothetical protein [Vibrio lentus]
MVAMKRRPIAGQLIDDLQLVYNKARRYLHLQELSEIVSWVLKLSKEAEEWVKNREFEDLLKDECWKNS